MSSSSSNSSHLSEYDREREINELSIDMIHLRPRWAESEEEREEKIHKLVECARKMQDLTGQPHELADFEVTKCYFEKFWEICK